MYYDPNQQVLETLLRGIKREASALDLYGRLANLAPDQQLFHTLEEKKARLSQFTNLYVQLTGTQPVYQIDRIPFNSYSEGLQRAHEVERAGYQEYQQFMQHPQIRNIFMGAFPDASRQRMDFGGQPFVVDINKAAERNRTFRTALWTGRHLQVTLMSINVGDDIGLEIHPNLDQFLRVEEGQGVVQMGDRRDRLNFQRRVSDDFAIMIPAGKWHNLINTGNKPLKLYSIYAPPQHPFGTVHKTKAEAMAAEAGH